MHALEQFRGNLLIYIGDDDAVIPKGVIELMDRHSTNVKRKEIIRISQLGHSIPIWMAENPALRMEIAGKLVELLVMS